MSAQAVTQTVIAGVVVVLFIGYCAYEAVMILVRNRRNRRRWAEEDERWRRLFGGDDEARGE
jgi:uncharacterized membrane protein